MSLFLTLLDIFKAISIDFCIQIFGDFTIFHHIYHLSLLIFQTLLVICYSIHSDLFETIESNTETMNEMTQLQDEVDELIDLYQDNLPKYILFVALILIITKKIGYKRRVN